MLEEEAGHLVGCRQASHHHIELAQAKLLEQHRIFAGDDLDRTAGVLLQKQAHGARHDMRRDGGQRADADRRAGLGGGIGDGIDALPQRGDRQAGVLHEDFTRTRDLDAAPVAFEHGHAKCCLEFPDRLCHGGLADIQHAGRLDHAFLARDFEKGLEVTEPDAAFYHGSFITPRLREGQK